MTPIAFRKRNRHSCNTSGLLGAALQQLAGGRPDRVGCQKLASAGVAARRQLRGHCVGPGTAAALVELGLGLGSRAGHSLGGVRAGLFASFARAGAGLDL